MKKQFRTGVAQRAASDCLDIQLPLQSGVHSPQYLPSLILIGFGAILTTVSVSNALSRDGFIPSKASININANGETRFSGSYTEGATTLILPPRTEDIVWFTIGPILLSLFFLGLGLLQFRKAAWTHSVESIRLDGRRLTAIYVSNKGKQEKTFQIPHYARAKVISTEDDPEKLHLSPHVYSIQIDTVCSASGLTLGIGKDKEEFTRLSEQINSYLEMQP